jgi:hypothetical protein
MICSHGETVAYCYDDATPAQRAQFDSLHRHAYEWTAGGHGVRTRDEAEAYAAWFAGLYWADADEDVPPHPVAARDGFDRAGNWSAPIY